MEIRSRDEAQPMDEKEQLRESIKDVITLTKVLAPRCKDVEGMLSILALCLDHDDLLFLVLQLVSEHSKGKK